MMMADVCNRTMHIKSKFQCNDMCVHVRNKFFHVSFFLRHYWYINIYIQLNFFLFLFSHLFANRHWHWQSKVAVVTVTLSEFSILMNGSNIFFSLHTMGPHGLLMCNVYSLSWICVVCMGPIRKNSWNVYFYTIFSVFLWRMVFFFFYLICWAARFGPNSHSCSLDLCRLIDFHP